MKRFIARYGQPRVTITDKLRSYIKPIVSLTPDAEHRVHKGLINLIEGSHRPTLRREKLMRLFTSARQAHRFLAAHDQIDTIFRPHRYQLSSTSYRYARSNAFNPWKANTTEMTELLRYGSCLQPALNNLVMPLTGVKAPKLEQRVMPWLLPNLVGGIAGLELVTLNSQQVVIIVNVGSPTTIGGWT